MARKLKENQHVRPVIDLTARTVTFEVKGHPAIVLDMGKLHASIVAQAAMVGMAQVRIVDAAAVGMADKEGNILPEAERIALKWSRMAALVDHYHTGTEEWSRQGTGEGQSLTIRAIAQVLGKSYDEAEAYVDAYAERNYEGDRKEALEFLRTGGRVMAAMAEIRAKSLKPASLDADAALGELTGEALIAE